MNDLGMVTGPTMLEQHYKASVAKFLKTVVVFDDQAYTRYASAAPIDLSAPSDDLDALTLERGPTLSSVFIDEPLVDAEQEVKVADSDHHLDGPGLVRLFATHGIVCSIIEPEGSDEVGPIIESIVNVASAADVLVLDWELRRGDHTATLSAIEQIIAADTQEGGRLRFIVIYTAAKGRDVKRALKGCFTDKFSQSGQLLKIDHACVTILNKPSFAHNDGVDLAALPDRIFELHSQFSSGLLPAAALAAIGTIRNHTHQILGQFQKSLDAAFITHRALIPKSEDAEAHLIELVADTLHHLMLSEGVRASLSNDLCVARLLELHQGGITDDAKAAIRDCVSNFKLDKLAVMTAALEVDLDEKNPEKKIIEKFYLSERESEIARKGMAFLHDFTRSHLQRVSAVHPPRLSLGTIVAQRVAEAVEYFVCIQPRCDSVRFDGVRKFPFMRLKAGHDTPNIHFLWDGSYKAARVSENLFDLHTFNFGFNGNVTDVVAADRDSNSQWFFSESSGEQFYWVGDLRKDKAQRLVSKIASRLHLPGINEYELTRRE